MNYATVSEVRQKISTTLTDTEIENIIKNSSNQIDDYVGQEILSETIEDIKIDGSGTPFLFLNKNIATYESVMQDDTEIQVIEYKKNNCVQYFGKNGYFKTGLQNITVKNAKIGLVQVLPQEIKDCCIAIVIKTINNGGIKTDTQQLDKKSERIGDYSVEYTQEDSKDPTLISVKSILDRYKKEIAIA